MLLKGRATDHLSRILFAQLGEIGCWRSRCRITRLCDVCDGLEPDLDLQLLLAAPEGRAATGPAPRPRHRSPPP